MTMSMWLRREIRLACACGCGQMSDEQTGSGRGLLGWGEQAVEMADDDYTRLLGRGWTREGWARRRDGSTLVDVDVGGGQGAGSPVCLRLHRLPSPRVRSKTLGLSQCLCARRQKSRSWAAAGGAPSGEDRIRTGPLPPHLPIREPPASQPPALPHAQLPCPR